MAIYKMVGDKERLEAVAATSFGQEGVLERSDLQRILRDQPEVLEDGLLVIAEEFGNWEDSNRRIDLLALDSVGRLVVIELKRGETGGHMDLQAIRYAAMVANVTYEQIVEYYQSYLVRRATDGQEVEEDAAESLIRDHLAGTDVDVPTVHSEIPRIILDSENFSKELTTCVMWLNDSWLSSEKLDIKCVRLQPHRNGEEILLEASVVVPLPEASDYQIRLAQRERESRAQYAVLGQNAGRGQHFDGSEVFLKSIASSQERFHSGLNLLYESAIDLQRTGLAELSTYVNAKGDLLRLELGIPGQSKYLVSFNNLLHKGGRGGEISFWPDWESVAPEWRLRMNEVIGQPTSKNGVQHRRLSRLPNVTEVLRAIHEAYREANGLLIGQEDAQA
ncbi:MAG: hypothetical protein OXI91_00780 [Chloroflexota bacterium]|nr:hypothetical protein [Chloroflexota bacterium]